MSIRDEVKITAGSDPEGDSWEAPMLPSIMSGGRLWFFTSDFPDWPVEHGYAGRAVHVVHLNPDGGNYGAIPIAVDQIEDVIEALRNAAKRSEYLVKHYTHERLATTKGDKPEGT
jgi:hypothetical protein